MDNMYNNNPHIYDGTDDFAMNNDMYDVYSTRYDNRRFMDDYFRRYNDMYNYDRRFDRRFDRNRYYQYPYCDRYGRCDNSLWWLFWPFFFL